MTVRGAVNARLEAILRLHIYAPSGAEVEIDAVVDTGYTGTLCLSAAVVASLGLVRRSGGRAVLADGSVRRFDTYAAEIDWGGVRRGIVVSVLGDEALAGMGLLAGHGLWIEVVEAGAVEVEPLV